MTGPDLLEQPFCSDDDLGRAIPPSPHAVSVALPRWSDVIGYEEHDERVWRKVQTGYPRFVTHPRVRELGRQLGGEKPCLPFPNAGAARACAAYVRHRSGVGARVVGDGDLYGVVTAAEGAEALRAFWQHTGAGMSSRKADALLDGRTPTVEGGLARSALRALLAEWYGCAPSDVYLCASGMASLYEALQAVSEFRPGRPTAQLGFPYVDTLKLQEEFGHGAVFIHALDETLPARVAEALEQSPLAACFCEIPGNPMLGSPDLAGLRPWLREHGVPLVVDDTIATPFNVDLGEAADLVCTSLTKFIAGSGDVMGGALVCPPRSPYYADLKRILDALHEDLLWDEDAVRLARLARDFSTRMRRHNAGGLYLAERVRQHPAAEQVWYPKWENAEAYEAVRSPQGGWGALFTMLPKDPERNAPRLYDTLPLCKGPSLGTVYTLACPFTLLAHYRELDWAESLGVSRYLVRFSVGLEDPEELWRRVKGALDRL